MRGGAGLECTRGAVRRGRDVWLEQRTERRLHGRRPGRDPQTGARAGGAGPRWRGRAHAVTMSAAGPGTPCVRRPAMAVGFIGLGNIGAPIAQRLVGRGLVVYDIRPEACGPFRYGATVADSVADLAARCDVTS